MLTPQPPDHSKLIVTILIVGGIIFYFWSMMHESETRGIDCHGSEESCPGYGEPSVRVP